VNNICTTIPLSILLTYNEINAGIDNKITNDVPIHYICNKNKFWLMMCSGSNLIYINITEWTKAQISTSTNSIGFNAR